MALDYPPLPIEPLSLLYHRRRRVRARSRVRLAIRFRQWCRRLRDTEHPWARDYAEECNMSARELLADDERADRLHQEPY